MAPRAKKRPPLDAARSITLPHASPPLLMPCGPSQQTSTSTSLPPSQPTTFEPVTRPRKRPRLVTSLPDSQGTPSSSPAPNKGRKNWENDGQDGFPSSMRLLLDWMSNITHHERLRFGSNGHNQIQSSKALAEHINAGNPYAGRTWQAARKKLSDLYKKWKESSDWKNSTGTGGGQRTIDNAPLNARDDAEQDVINECRARCPFWDELDELFRDRDGGTASLRADSGSGTNPVLAALETDETAVEGPVDDSEQEEEGIDTQIDEVIDQEDENRSNQSILDQTQFDRRTESSVTRPGANEPLSISDRRTSASSRRTTAAADSVNHGVDNFVNAEQEWRQKKEGHMRRQEELQLGKMELKREELRLKRLEGISTVAKLLFETYNGSKTYKQCMREAKELEEEF